MGRRTPPLTGLTAGLAAVAVGTAARPQSGPQPPSATYTAEVRPLLGRYCLDCHSTKARKGGVDLERFGTPEAARKDLKVWGHVLDQVEAGEMPLNGKPQPTAEERRRLVAWVRWLPQA